MSAFSVHSHLFSTVDAQLCSEFEYLCMVLLIVKKYTGFYYIDQIRTLPPTTPTCSTSTRFVVYTSESVDHYQ